MPRCYYSRSKADGRRREARGNPRFISQSVTPGLLLLCCFKGYRIPPPSRARPEGDSRSRRKASERRTLRTSQLDCEIASEGSLLQGVSTIKYTLGDERIRVFSARLCVRLFLLAAGCRETALTLLFSRYYFSHDFDRKGSYRTIIFSS